MNEEQKSTIEIRKDKNKELILEHLKKTPIIEIACQKSSISRATLYRWKARDQAFANAVEVAITEGTALVNDVAESQLLAAIKNGNLTAIIFWLKSRNRRYSDKVELTGRIEHIQKRELTPEEKELIEKSLRLAMPKEETILQIPERSNIQPNDDQQHGNQTIES